MRKTISVAALLLALTCPAYAGDIQNDSPKPQATTAQEPTAQGDIQNGVADAIADAALIVLDNVLSLL
jgi:hypothetical protein